MKLIVYVFIFISAVFILIEVVTVYCDITRKSKVRQRLRDVQLDEVKIKELTMEQHRKLSDILETIQIDDVDYTREIETTLKSFRKYQSSLNSE